MSERRWQGWTSEGRVTRSNRASGIWAGVIWGGVVAGCGLALASLMGPQPAGQSPPQSPLLEPPEVTGALASELSDPAVVQASDEGAAPRMDRTLSEGGALEGDLSAGTVPQADTASAPLPRAGGIGAEAPDPGSVAEMGDPLPPPLGAPGQGAGPAPLMPAPESPAPDTQVVVETSPPQPASVAGVADDPSGAESMSGPPGEPAGEPPGGPPTTVADAPEPAEAAEPAGAAEPADANERAVDAEPRAAAAAEGAGEDDGLADPDSTDVIAQPSDQATAPVGPGDDEQDPADDPPEAVAASPGPLPSGAQDRDGSSGPGVDAPTETTDDPPPEQAEEVAEPGSPVDPQEGTDIAEPAAPPARIVVGGGAALPRTDSGVRINRPEGAAPEPSDPDRATEATGDPVDPDAPALQRFAAAAVTTAEGDGRPQLSIILIDDGTLDAAVAALAALPIPVTIALDPGQAGVTNRMLDLRAAGFEVISLARLPTGAQPTDVAVALEGAFAALPEAIGILDAGEGGMQANSAITDQTMDRLARDGRGLVVVPQGLNMALRSADAAGVPGVAILRDLDADGQDAAAIRRQLDQAAFTARRDGAVVLLARLRPDTLSALMLWGSSAQAGQVVVVPVSARLLAGSD
ncbi:MAG: divergent polysaccharide deacetylase family protein [Rubellimicrobium sp.]|nr:divergent polysaccharide deacetylase family protein [Rubellimicrobium sp.]